MKNDLLNQPATKGDIQRLDEKIEQLKGAQQNTDNRLGKVETRLGNVENRQKRMEKRQKIFELKTEGEFQSLTTQLRKNFEAIGNQLQWLIDNRKKEKEENVTTFHQVENHEERIKDLETAVFVNGLN